MKIGVPKETAQGERRVALVPDVVASLAGKGRRGRRRVRRRRGRRPSRLRVHRGRRRRSATTPGAPTSSLKVAAPTAEEIGRLQQGQVLIGHLAPLTSAETNQGARRRGRHQLRDGGDPADHPRPGDGRALLAGQPRRLRGDAARRPRGRPLLPDDDHRRRHGRRRPRCWSSAPASPGLQAIATAKRLGARRHRLRHPPRRLGADRSRSAAARSSSTSSPTPRARAATRGR